MVMLELSSRVSRSLSSGRPKAGSAGSTQATKKKEREAKRRRPHQLVVIAKIAGREMYVSVFECYEMIGVESLVIKMAHFAKGEQLYRKLQLQSLSRRFQSLL